jgi:hypothetical protein
MLKAAMADARLRDEQAIRDVKHEVELLRKASDDQQKLQEQETQTVAELCKVVRQMATQFEDLRSVRSWGNGPGEQTVAGTGCQFKQRIKVLDQENRCLSAANEVVKNEPSFYSSFSDSAPSYCSFSCFEFLSLL